MPENPTSTAKCTHETFAEKVARGIEHFIRTWRGLWESKCPDILKDRIPLEEAERRIKLLEFTERKQREENPSNEKAFELAQAWKADIDSLVRSKARE